MGDDQVKPDASMFIMCDATVLIDYIKANKRILSLVSRRIGQLHVPRPVFDEVNQIGEQEAERLGISITEPEFPQILKASARGGPLSRVDKLTLIMARDLRCMCWTNDARLKKQCEQENVPVRWGLEMMLVLCKDGHLSKHEAIRTARTIKAGGAYVSAAIMRKFEDSISEI